MVILHGTPALALSDACDTLNASYSAGVTRSSPNSYELVVSGFNADEEICYRIYTSGSDSTQLNKAAPGITGSNMAQIYTDDTDPVPPVRPFGGHEGSASGSFNPSPTLKYYFTTSGATRRGYTGSATMIAGCRLQGSGSDSAPVAGDVTATVAANSSANAVTLALSGGAASSVAVTTAPGHGTATASGTGITYTPTAGFSGSDRFTYTATNAAGTSSAATVTLTVSKPTLAVSPATGPLPAAIVGTAYATTLTSAEGTAPYGYTATGLPAGITLATDGTLSGTPTTAGSYTVVVTATDAHGATGTGTYSFAVSLPPRQWPPIQ